MINHLLSYLAPHLCCGCGQIGTVLCDNCKYDITTEDSGRCINCNSLAGTNGICRRCNVPYSKAWYIGERSGVLQRLIGDFKFQNSYEAYRPLAMILSERLPDLSPDTIIVPVPTAPGHIRQRGYDHMRLIARAVARHRHLTVSPVLLRMTSTTQRGANRAQRIAQAKKAFGVHGVIDATAPYLLIDDVVTTGSTVKYAAKALSEAGATIIWVAVIAKQPLD